MHVRGVSLIFTGDLVIGTGYGQGGLVPESGVVPGCRTQIRSKDKQRIGAVFPGLVEYRVL
jgi:hypothetical protein